MVFMNDYEEDDVQIKKKIYMSAYKKRIRFSPDSLFVAEATALSARVSQAKLFRSLKILF